MQAQRKKAETAAKEAFFREALQELTLFKSRTSAALLQAQEQLHSATQEAQVSYLPTSSTHQTLVDSNMCYLNSIATLVVFLARTWMADTCFPNNGERLAQARPGLLLI